MFIIVLKVGVAFKKSLSCENKRWQFQAAFSDLAVKATMVTCMPVSKAFPPQCNITS